MKRKYLKRIMSALMVGVIVLSGCGCATKDKTVNNKEQKLEPEKSNAISFDFIGGKDVMPIGGYIGPYSHSYSYDGNIFPYFNTDEYYQLLADAGINLVTYTFTDYQTNPQFIKESLELSEKYGIGLFVNDKNITDKTQTDDVTADDLAGFISAYSDYPAFCGVHLVDEPRTVYFEPGNGKKLVPTYGQVAKLLHNELDMPSYLNILPIFDFSEKGKENFVRYVKEFCDTLQPKFLCFDCYIFDEYRWGTEDMFFWMMDVIFQEAEARNLPVWTSIQAGSQWSDGGEAFDSKTPFWPNEGQFNWNINVSLAYGVQGFQYFPLMQPESYARAITDDWDFQRNGILGLMGNKTQWYNYSQNITKHIREIDEVLMNSVNKGVIASGEQTKKDLHLVTRTIESGTFQQLQSVDGDAMVGCFNYNGKTALYVVNYSTEYAQYITLGFDGTQNIQKIQGAETSYVKAENLKLDMAAGEGVLLVIE